MLIELDLALSRVRIIPPRSSHPRIGLDADWLESGVKSLLYGGETARPGSDDENAASTSHEAAGGSGGVAAGGRASGGATEGEDGVEEASSE